MDGRSTFLHWRGFKEGLEKDSGGGQWLSPVRPGTAGPSLRLAAGEAVRPCFLEKSTCTNPPSRTETDTGGRVQTYQGAREKPR